MFSEHFQSYIQNILKSAWAYFSVDTTLSECKSQAQKIVRVILLSAKSNAFYYRPIHPEDVNQLYNCH